MGTGDTLADYLHDNNHPFSQDFEPAQRNDPEDIYDEEVAGCFKIVTSASPLPVCSRATVQLFPNGTQAGGRV